MYIFKTLNDETADISLVMRGGDGKPECTDHGAMNKVSPSGVWRCLRAYGECNAGVETEYKPVQVKMSKVDYGNDVHDAIFFP